jgi:integrase
MKDGRRSCSSCQKKKRTAYYLSEDYLNRAFTTVWGKELLKKLGLFLEAHEIRFETRGRMLPKAAKVFQEAERCFKGPEWIELQWLEEMIEKMGVTLFPTFFRAFLVQEQLLEEPSKDEKRLQSIHAQVERLPQGYRRAVEVYVNDRLALRARQIQFQAKRPLALTTIASDLDTLSRLVRWLTASLPQLTGWDMVQEEHIYAFLLTLTPKTREILRRDLYQFFRLARRRRLITHIPLMKLPGRELPRTIEPLSLEEQRIVARRIRENLFTCPEEAWLSALCFYHGLSSSQICCLRTEQVDVERGIIVVEGRPPVYLLAEDFLLLEQFLQRRKGLPYAKKKSYLVISNQTKIDDKPMTQEYVAEKVRVLTGHTSQCLRITCFAALSVRYGPQHLVEAFGLSLDQACRYADLKEFLLEEEIKQQREEFLDLSRHLK